MVFVNHIGNILHADVHHSGGFPNKNIGDAFLFVWKLQSNYSGIESLKSRAQTQIAQNALGCFIKCALHIAYSNERGVLSHYKDHPAMQSRFFSTAGSKQKFQVKLGFGIHMGWAIEGPIGSKYKIDVSYLSPHINIAARLEAATKQFVRAFLFSRDFLSERKTWRLIAALKCRYKVDVLFSSSMYALLSSQVQQYCRKLDCVMVKGSEVPLDLYVYARLNMNSRSLRALSVECTISSHTLRMHLLVLRVCLISICSTFRYTFDIGTLKQRHVIKLIATKRLCFSTVTMRLLQLGIPQEFFDTYSSALQLYIAGKWGEALQQFSQALALR